MAPMVHPWHLQKKNGDVMDADTSDHTSDDDQLLDARDLELGRVGVSVVAGERSDVNVFG